MVSLSLGNTTLANNSVVVITDIGDAADNDTSPLICTTTFTPCCNTLPNRHGFWYYPDGTLVPNNQLLVKTSIVEEVKMVQFV